MDFEPIRDKYGNTPDSPAWRTLNDTWVFLCMAGGRRMYQKVIGNHILPDVVAFDMPPLVDVKKRRPYDD